MIGLGIRTAALSLMRGLADMTIWALMGVAMPLIGAWMAALTLGFYLWFTL